MVQPSSTLFAPQPLRLRRRYRRPNKDGLLLLMVARVMLTRVALAAGGVAAMLLLIDVALVSCGSMITNAPPAGAP